LPSYRTEIASSHRAEDLLALVADVKGYPAFIPWIKAMRVWNVRQGGGGRDLFDAEAVIGYKMLSERFSTAVACDRTARTVTTRLLRGPFRSLENRWSFAPADPGTSVTFAIDYEFSNPVLAALLQNNFDRFVGKIIKVFLAEADRRYGARTAS
jgi:coenzyme Q-binding protein COQ10